MLTAIRPRLIADYKSKRRVDGVSPKTINNELTLMSHAFTLCVKSLGAGQGQSCETSVQRKGAKSHGTVADIGGRSTVARRFSAMVTAVDRVCCQHRSPSSGICISSGLKLIFHEGPSRSWSRKTRASIRYR